MLKFKKKSFKEKSCIKLLVLIHKKLNFSFFSKNEDTKPTPISEKSNMFNRKKQSTDFKKHQVLFKHYCNEFNVWFYPITSKKTTLLLIA
jgi:hypothetical protein